MNKAFVPDVKGTRDIVGRILRKDYVTTVFKPTSEVRDPMR